MSIWVDILLVQELECRLAEQGLVNVRKLVVLKADYSFPDQCEKFFFVNCNFALEQICIDVEHCSRLLLK